MKNKVISIAAVLLLLVGFSGGYLANLALGQGGALAADPPKISAATGTSVDTAIEQAYQKARKSVVFVSNSGIGTGSGVIYDSHGDIVTNAHVTSGTKTFRVTFSNGKTATARLVGTDTADDLAVIHVSVRGLTPATFARARSYSVAETVLAIGSPLGLQQSVTSGLISGLNRTEQEPDGAYIQDAIQTSAPINPGNSGGALVSLNGDVVGIPTMVQTSDAGNATVQDLGFAIPSSRVIFVANQIIAHGRVTHTDRAFLGVSVGDAGSTQTIPFVPNGRSRTVAGAIVNGIESNGPAEKAGIRQGDVIIAVDGASITNASDLLAALARDKPGQMIMVKINRNGTIHSVQVTLGQLPASQ